jgi:hypothetical protein
MYVAWCSRNLPSAFNEKDQIFKVGFINAAVIIVVTATFALTDEPTTSPNLPACLAVVMAVVISLSTSLFVIQPKIQRVRSGEPIVMTTILRDMNGLGSSSASIEEEYYKRASEEAVAAESLQGVSARMSTATLPSTVSTVNVPDSAFRIASGQVESKKVTTAPVVLKYDDPIPKDVERQLYRLNELLDSVTKRWYVAVDFFLFLWSSKNCWSLTSY